MYTLDIPMYTHVYWSCTPLRDHCIFIYTHVAIPMYTYVHSRTGMYTHVHSCIHIIIIIIIKVNSCARMYTHVHAPMYIICAQYEQYIAEHCKRVL